MGALPVCRGRTSRCLLPHRCEQTATHRFDFVAAGVSPLLEIQLPPNPPGYETGEDFMLSYSLRKYAHIESYVLPIDNEYPLFLGNVDRLRVMSETHATTDSRMVRLRNQMFHANVQHGGRYLFTTKRQRDKPVFLVYIDPAVPVRTYQNFLRPLVKQASKRANIFYLLPGETETDGCAKLMATIL